MRRPQLHITQHKRFVPLFSGTHPNPALFRVEKLRAVERVMTKLYWNAEISIIKKCWTSFMQGTLYAISRQNKREIL